MIDISEIHEAIQVEIDNQPFGNYPAELYDPIRYILSLGGKRFRPALTLLTAAAFSDEWRKAILPAIAIEVFHNFTLMHDDFMDNAPLRRGKPTVHSKWNPNVAILSGDVMLVKAYDLLAKTPTENLRYLFQRFSKVAAEVCEGQQLDMNYESDSKVTKENYIEMIRLKTSVLVGLSMELGGAMAGVTEDVAAELYQAGVDIGLGFQLMDDLLDVYGDPSLFGKQVGGDIIANKKTYLLLDALENAKEEEEHLLHFWLNAETFDQQEKVEEVTGIFTRLQVKEHTEQVMEMYFQRGFERIHALSIAPERKAPLINFIEQLAARRK